MENVENKYHHSKIYRITDNNYTKFYYGSTTKPLVERMAHHRYAFKNGSLSSSSKYIFEEFGIDNVKIELVEAVKCENKEELNKIEGKYIQENICVNRKVSGRSIAESNKISKIKNREKAKETMKKYLETHKEERKAKRKIYLANNKDKLDVRQNEKIPCECGLMMTRRSMSRHVKTNKHESRMKEKTP
jgi:hypothetical protein